jgi:hypothetical protein
LLATPQFPWIIGVIGSVSRLVPEDREHLFGSDVTIVKSFDNFLRAIVQSLNVRPKIVEFQQGGSNGQDSWHYSICSEGHVRFLNAV